MTRLTKLLRGRTTPIVIPGAHDALSARIIEVAGFEMLGIGGAGLAASQLGMPDIGVQSFGEYRDAVRRIREATTLPMMVDGENGFGDAKAITRTVRTFEEIGVTALAIEDLDFPPRLNRPPSVITRESMIAKLRAAVASRREDGLSIIARTDAAYCVGSDEAIARAAAYQAAGADAILAVGMPDLDSLARLRDAVDVAIIVLSVPGSPWYAPSPEDARQIGADAIIYPAAVLLYTAAGIADGLAAIREDNGAPPAGFDFARLSAVLNAADWATIDRT